MEAQPILEFGTTAEVVRGTDSFSSVSLILLTSEHRTDAQVWHNVRALGAADWRCQVLLIDPLAVETTQPVTRLISKHLVTYRPVPQVFRDLNQALAAAKHEVIVVVDECVKLDPNQWSWVARNRSQSTNPATTPVQAVFQTTIPKAGVKRLLTAFYHGLNRFLLKTNKSPLRPGFIVLSASQTQQLLSPIDSGRLESSTDTGESSDQLTFANTTELLAFARLHRFPIEEIETRVVNTDIPIADRSKQLLKAIRRTIQFWWNRLKFPVDSVTDLGRQPAIPTSVSLAAWSVLIVATCLLLFGNLNYPLFEPDETRNSQLAMNIIHSNNWMSLTLGGEPYWDKPPAQIWAIAFSYKMFGINSMATRLPGALAAALTILLTLGLGQKLIGFRAAFVGAVSLLLSTGFLLLGRFVTLDASLTCCVFSMSLALLLACRRPVPSRASIRGWLLVAGIAAGVGFLVKGPIVLVLGIPPVLVAAWLAGNLSIFKRLHTLLFFVPVLLIAGPWFLATGIVHPDFLTYFFWKHHVVRFADAFNHREPFWYYLPAIFIMMLPVSYLLPSLVKFFGSQKLENRSLRTPDQGFLCLMALWIIGFFSLSESKLPTYILPALPPIALLIGVLLDKKILARSTKAIAARSITNNASRSFLERFPQQMPFWILAISVSIVLVMTLAFQTKLPLPLGWLLVISALLFPIALVPRWTRTSPTIAWSCVALASCCLVTTSVHYLVPQLAHQRSVQSTVAALKRQPEFQSAPIVFFGRKDHGAELMLNPKEIVNFDSWETDAICQYLKQHAQAIIISSDPEITNLRNVLPRTLELQSSLTMRHLYISQAANAVPERTAQSGKWDLVR